MGGEHPRDRSREPLVKVAIAENPATAELIRQLLADADVPCLVKNTDPLGVLYGSTWTGAYAVQIYVLAGDEKAALTALTDQGLDAFAPPKLAPLRRYKRRR